MSNIRKTLISIAFFLFFFSLISSVYAATPISSCTVINTPGEYYLTQDIINSGASNCIDIRANNVIFDCQGHTIDGIDASGTNGIRAYISARLTNITIVNCIVSDWYIGVRVENSDYNTISNIITYSNLFGLRVFGSQYSNVSNIVAYSNTYYGLQIYSQYSNFSNITTYSNVYGVYAYGSDFSTFSNITTYSNTYGIYLDSIAGAILKDSKITDNSYGIYIYYVGSGNSIYNNLFNQTTNFYIESAYSVYWNTTLTPGTNIVGGPYIGGNYWGSPDGTGFSDTCTDANKDGICDSSYTLATNNIDYLPLAKYALPYTEITDCTTITSPGEYRLVNDIIDADVDVCIDIQSDDVILDCQGHILDQVYPPSEWYGVGINIDSHSNVTIKNCVFGDWLYYGIYSYQSSDITILNSSFTFGSSFGGQSFRFENSNNCYIDNITSYRVLDIRGLSSNCYLNNLYLSGGYAGIYILDSSSIAIRNIKMIETQSINIENSDHINVTNAYVGALYDGIDLTTVEYSNFNNIEIYGIDRETYFGYHRAHTGIYIYSSNFNNFTNITISNFKHEGIWLGRWSSSNTFINVSISDIVGGNGLGVYVWRESNDNYFKGLTIRNTSSAGIFVDYFSAYNVFEDFVISDIVGNGIWFTMVQDTNEFRKGRIERIHLFPDQEELTGSGIRLEDAANQVFHEIIIKNSDNCGVYLWSSENNLFYNNIFMNINNVCFDVIYPNYWNTTLTPGTNIVGGPYIGGNYWGSPDGTGFSDTCSDANNDGICDDPYILGTDNIDYLPLTRFVAPAFSVVFNYNSVNFGTVIPNTIAEAKSINYNVSITSTLDYKVSASATDWSGPTTIPANTLYFAVSNTLDGLSFAIARQLSNVVQLIATFSSSVTTNYHAFYFNVPLAPPGVYTATVTITYEVV